jgi:hypothetical protein
MSDDTPIHLGDLASDIAARIQRETMAAINLDADAVDQAAPMIADQKKNVFSKVEFRWRTDDRQILDQIRIAATEVFWSQFEHAVTVVDKFYASVRVADTRVVGNHELVNTDAQRRVIFKKDSTGQYAEDWSRLTGQDIEVCLLDLSRLKLVLSQQLTELLNEAVFAKHIYDDAYQEGYASLIEGTQGDRNARASRESRVDKYHAYFRYYLYSQSEAFMRELSDLMRRLERIRDWRVRTQRD